MKDRKMEVLTSLKAKYKSEENKKLVNFYLENALISLNTARLLHKISSDDDVKKQFNFISRDFESYLWIINSSYYSMFYIAGALLASIGVKVKSEIGIHKKTFECFVYYFYLTNKIAKRYLEEYNEAKKESQELLGLQEMQKKAKELIENYDFERTKRSRFTYEMGEKAKSVKAATSLKRAVEFYNECLKIINS